MKDALPVRVRFGAFELDLKAGELRLTTTAPEGESRIVLPDQPFRLLVMLVEREGTIVTREEIQKKFWPNDTIVEFDHSINVAIGKLRKALGDSADEPKYIDTVARRGYRLIVPVERPEAAADEPPNDEPSSDTGAAVEIKSDSTGLIGKKVSHYRVLQVIGCGGMGLVYKAEDLKLGRCVALKFLPDELALDPGALQRFEREAQTASSLNHPNICTIYEVEEHESNPFIVMELLEGETLRDRLARLAAARQVLALDQLLDFGVQICAGLQAAHDRGIIHRDIKPANLFLTASGQVKILDFGVAKLAAATEAAALSKDQSDSKANHAPVLPTSIAANDRSLTRTGAAMGTAGYMSPEQARGEKLDTRTDLFSLGLLLYEMATGQRAFSGETAAVFHNSIVNKTPVPPHELNSKLPLKLENIIGKALEKDRERRYQSAAEMRAELETVSANQPPLTRPWKLIASAAIILVAIAMVAGGLYWRLHGAIKFTGQDAIVLGDFANSTGEAVFDGTLKQALTIQLEQSPFLNVLSQKRVSDTLKLMNRQAGEKLTPEVAREVCLRTNSRAFLEGSIAAIGQVFLITEQAVDCHTGETVASVETQAQNRSDVLKALQDVGNQLRTKLGESLSSIEKFNQPLEQATTSSLEALQAYTLGVKTLHEKSSFDAIPYLQRSIALDSNFALAHASLRSAYYSRWDFTPAYRACTKAYELRDRVSQRERLLIEGVYYERVTGESEKALQSRTEMAQLYPNDYLAHDNLGGIYFQLGHYENALAEFQQAHRVSPDETRPLFSLTAAYIALGRWKEAKAAFDEIQARFPDQTEFLYRRYWLAFAQDDKVAMQEVAAKAVGTSSEKSLLYAQSRAEGYHGRLEKAQEFLRRAVDMSRRDTELETGARWRTDAALRDAEIGYPALARRKAAEALQLSDSKDIRIAAALAFTRAGDLAKGRELTQELNREFPRDTLLQDYWLPTIAAASETRQNNPTKALDLLSVALPYEMCELMVPIPNYYAAYLRGLAYLKLGQGENAAAEFQKIIDHPGIVWAGITGALARLGLARAYALEAAKEPAVRDKARAAYQNFLTLWKDADPDIPIYQQAKAEYARLR
jgi:serine/threonine protein kinase/tetratricopeptide (TPR) repeat protein